MTQKLYCYVDESGQDTQGRLFIVSVVLVGAEKEQIVGLLETIELETGKHRVKWSKSANALRLAYLRRVFELVLLRDKITFAIHTNSLNYLELTQETILKSFERVSEKNYQGIVLIDALPKVQAEKIGSWLRRHGVRAKKVRGVRREESDALMRLVDAICGLVRDTNEGRSEMQELYVRARQRKLLVELPLRK